MGNRSDIFDHADFHTGGGDTADGGFSAGTGSFDPDFDFFHTQKLGFFGGIAGDDLSRISGALTGAFETVFSAGGPADHVAVEVGKGNFGIVERRQDIGDAAGNIATALAALFRGSGGGGDFCLRGGDFRNFLIGILSMYAIIALLLHKLTISAIVPINRNRYDQKQF